MAVAAMMAVMAACLLASCEDSAPVLGPTGAAKAEIGEFSPPSPALRRRLAIVQRHAEADERFSPALSAAPGGLLLIEADQETLFCNDGAADGFTDIGRDPISGCAIAARAPSGLPLAIKATFPAVQGRPTIVIGAPETTGESLGGWTVTLVHERLHALQQSQADYAANTLALDLHDGDETGMWMLDFAYPYDDPVIAAVALDAAQRLHAALEAINTPGFQSALIAYRQARARWAEASGARNWRYVEFQLWQEGVARYLELATARDTPPGRDRAVDYVALAGNLERALYDELVAFDLTRNRRVSFYAVGAGEALLLDALDPNWTKSYFDGALALGPRLDAAMAR